MLFFSHLGILGIAVRLGKRLRSKRVGRTDGGYGEGNTSLSAIDEKMMRPKDEKEKKKIMEEAARGTVGEKK